MFTTADMSRIVVAGTLDQLSATIELAARLNAIHLIDHSGDELGLGSPEGAADALSRKLATMRGCSAALHPTEDEEVLAAPLVRRELDENMPALIESAVTAIQQLENLKGGIEIDLERARILTLLAPLGLELELMQGYDSLDVFVGMVPNLAECRLTLNTVKGSGQISSGIGRDGVVAVFTPKEGSSAIQTMLAGHGFQPLQVPTGEGMPSELLGELEQRIREAESEQEKLQHSLDEWTQANGGMLLGSMELLERDLDLQTAPIKVAVSEHAFVLEGWVPTVVEQETRQALSAVAAHVETEEFEMPRHHDGLKDETAESPPIAFTNSTAAQPYELLTDAVGRPKYGRIDPTSFMLLTYPLFFGLMLGDLAYGLATIGIGIWIMKRFHKIEMATLVGKLLVYIGISTAIFGIIFGEVLGFDVTPGSHNAPFWLSWMSMFYPEHSWEVTLPLNIVFAYPFHRVGHNLDDMIILTLYLGVLHLFLGMLIGFRDVLKEHGLTAAIFEKGSWMLVLGGGFFAVYAFMMKDGLWTDRYLEILGWMGTIGAAVMFTGIGMVIIMLWKYEGMPLPIAIGLGPLESLQILSNVISYVRIFAVGIVGVKIAELGNEKFFEPAVHAITDFASDPVGIILGIITIILMLALWLVVQIFALGLGLFSPNVQAARLHFVEWMGKFYEVGGQTFSPFGPKQRYVEVE